MYVYLIRTMLGGPKPDLYQTFLFPSLRGMTSSEVTIHG